MVFHRAFKEWCFALHEIEVLQGKSWIDCPSCFGSQHSCHVDGNAKLYRYRCVPRGERKCYYGDLFIENDEKVNAHLTSIYSHASPKNHSSNTYCGTSNWKAARNTACRRSKLDETGLSVAGCRHAVAQAAVNMHQGELYGYTHYLQINRLVPQHVKFLWQDVVCKYWPWFTSLPKELSPAEAFLMKPALSIMHGKAHIWSCQVTWGGRWQTGSGYTAGEEVEQINSYISRLGSTTKYMHAAGRNEALTEHVLHWNKLKVLKLPTSLCKKYVSVKKLIEQNKEELLKLMKEVNVTNYVENNILEIWVAEIMACGKRTLSGKFELTKRQNDLITFYQLNTEIREAAALKPFVEESSDGVGMAFGNSDLYDQALGKQQNIEQKKRKLETLGSSLGVVECDSEKVKALEEGKKLLASKKRVAIREEIEMLCFSILQRKKNISRLADSSKQRSRLRSKNVNEKKKLEDSVQQYNVINRMLENVNAVVADLTSEQVLDGNYPWIDPQDNKAALPLRAKRKPAEVYLTGKRLQEEVKLLEEEMRRFLCYYRDNLMPNLSARLNFIEKDELVDEHVEEDIQQIEEGKYKANFSRLALAGEVALLKSGMFFCKGVIKEAITILKPVIEGTMDVDDFFDSGDEENEENLDEEDEEWEDE